MRTTCSRCGGRGQVVEQRCPACRGEGRVRNVATIKVTIPAGIESGMRIPIRGQGEQGEMGGPRGDLYLDVYVESHEFFQRQGEDVHCEVPITFSQSALGGEEAIPSLEEGKRVKVKVPKGTQSGKAIRLSGQGFPHIRGRGRGDMYVHLHVETPRRLTKKQEELFRKLAELEDKHVSPRRKSFFEKLAEYLTEED